MTSEQYAALPECERKLELLDGVVVMAARPRIDHQRVVGRLFAVLDLWTTQHGLGVVCPEPEVRLTDSWSPAPDLVFVSTANRGRIQQTHIQGPVDLAIEILSPSNTGSDREDKFAAYARFGIPWYWIVDLDARTLEEYQAENGVYIHRWDHPFDQPFSPRLFPGLTIDLADVV
jgi:Uma2 family endonuclease